MNAIIKVRSAYVVVTINPGQASAPMNARARKATGCSEVYYTGGDKAIRACALDGNVQHYSSPKAAREEYEGICELTRAPEYDLGAEA